MFYTILHCVYFITLCSVQNDFEKTHSFRIIKPVDFITIEDNQNDCTSEETALLFLKQVLDARLGSHGFLQILSHFAVSAVGYCA